MTPCVSWAPWDGCNPTPAERELGVMFWAAALLLIVALVISILRKK